MCTVKMYACDLKILGVNQTPLILGTAKLKCAFKSGLLVPQG